MEPRHKLQKVDLNIGVSPSRFWEKFRRVDHPVVEKTGSFDIGKCEDPRSLQFCGKDWFEIPPFLTAERRTKKLEHNLSLLAGVGEIAGLGCPVLVGPSRKRFLGELTGVAEPANRVAGTVAACVECWRRGATIFRVHDVAAVVQGLAVARAIKKFE